MNDKFRFEAHIVFISWVFQREKMWAWFVSYDKRSGKEGSKANLMCTVFHIGKLFQEILSSFLKCLGHPWERTHYHKHNIFIVTDDGRFIPRPGSSNRSSQKQNKTPNHLMLLRLSLKWQQIIPSFKMGSKVHSVSTKI